LSVCSKNKRFPTFSVIEVLQNRRAITVSAAFLSLSGLWFFAQTSTLQVPLWHIDGAFQTASALFRLDEGQVPGKDFYPYLGLSSVYVLFPFFKLAGGDLTAAATAAQFVVFVMAAASIAIVCRLTYPSSSFSACFAVAALIVPLLLALSSWGALPIQVKGVLGWSLEPGHSLRPLRGFAPYVAALAIMFAAGRGPLDVRRSALIGAIGGAVFWWSNDFGPPSALITALFMLYLLVRDGWTWPCLFAAGAAALAALVVVITLATAGHPVEFLRHSFGGVAADQWWYYSSFEPKDRVFAAADLALMVTRSLMIALVVLAYCIVRCFRRRAPESVLLALLGLALFLGGIVPSVGGHLDVGYFNSFKSWSLFTLFVLAAGPLARGFQHLVPNRFREAGPKLLMIGAVIIPVAILMSHYRQRDRLAHKTSLFYSADLGGFLPVEWRPYVDRARSSHVEAIEEYWGLWSALRRKSPGYVDSTIHALGVERDRFRRRLEAWPGLVITSRPQITEDYQGWSLTANWWFYRTLLKRYRAEVASPTTLVWKPARPRQWPRVPCRISSHERSVVITTPSQGLYEVTLEYSMPSGQRALLLVQTSLRAWQTGGWASLNPAAQMARFPVLVEANAPTRRVKFRLLPNGVEGRLRLLSCSAAAIGKNEDVLQIIPTIPEAGRYTALWPE